VIQDSQADAATATRRPLVRSIHMARARCLAPSTIPIACVIALACTLLALLPAHAAATFRGRDGRIAYYAFSQTESGSIYTVKPSGRGNRVVVRDARHPSWSADGKWLAFERDGGIWESRADGSHKRQVVPPGFRRGQVSGPAWSPTGRRIAFTYFRELGDGDDGGDVQSSHVARTFTIRRDGTHARRVSSWIASVAWAPDGRHIAFDNGKQVGWMRPDGSHKRVFARTPRGFDTGIDISPNGHRLVYFHDPSGDSGDGTIDILDVRTHKVRHVARMPRATPGGEPRFRPSGGWVGFIEPQVGPGNDLLRMMKLDGSGAHTLFDFPAGYLAGSFDWQPRPR
jgi:WD40 repeat protein